VVASRARSEGRTLLAGVLGALAAEFTSEAASLIPASRPEVRWPDRPLWQLDHETALDEWIETISASLQHSARTLRWIARRPDLPPLAGVTFDALAFARRAQKDLLLACSAIDD
jgi:hypothetical protein